jgi:hypothetical protein
MLFALAHARPLRMHEPSPRTGGPWSKSKSKPDASVVAGGGCGSFATCSFHPSLRLTGLATCAEKVSHMETAVQDIERTAAAAQLRSAERMNGCMRGYREHSRGRCVAGVRGR